MADEIKISCEEAESKFSVVARHGIMPTNGEQRFRLAHTASDTAYIRTVTSPNDFGWQNSHYHKSLQETYIVQSGWIGYSELDGKKPNVILYEAGAVFTTKPYVIHNIFMPRSCVIHTVKHGTSTREPKRNSDWWDDLPDVRALNEFLRSSLESEEKVRISGKE